MNMRFYGVILMLTSSVLCADVMVERMQSVVDEVSELRQRYESAVRINKDCQEQVQEQSRVIKKISMDEGVDYKVFEMNRERLLVLESENKRLKDNLVSKKDFERVNKELTSVSKENQRLNASAQILVEKNHSLLEQLNKTKRAKDQNAQSSDSTLQVKLKTLQSTIDTKDKEISALKQEQKVLQSKNIKLEEVVLAQTAVSEKVVADSSSICILLQEEKKHLEKALRESQDKECTHKKVIKATCIDDNPFPKLMMKNDPKTQAVVQKQKSIKAHNVQSQPVEEPMQVSSKVLPEPVMTQKASAYRLMREAPIYDAPDGNITQTWEARTSFTSNVTQGEWVKITGHFVNKKWQKSTEDMWVKMKDAIKR